MSLSGLAFVSSTLVTATVSSLVLLPPALVLLPLSSTLYHRWTNTVAALWFRLVVYLLERNGVNFVFTGDKVQAEPALVICNHRTRLDWLLLWGLFARSQSLTMLRIVLKSTMKGWPIMGFVMQTLGFLFLQRGKDRGNDPASGRDALEHMRDMLDTYATHGHTQLLLFPEGTDLSPSNLEKSQALAKKQGKPIPKHVLLPRTKGFVTCCERLGNVPGVSCALYDITLGFPDRIPQSEATIFKGTWPAEIHVDVEHIPAGDFPWSDNSKIEEWLEARFVTKERRLDAFARDHRFNDSNLINYGELSHRPVLGFWISVCGIFLKYLWTSSTFRWYCVAMLLVQQLVTKFGGLDQLEINLNKKNKLHKA